MERSELNPRNLLPLRRHEVGCHDVTAQNIEITSARICGASEVNT
jgi:hypothetical protein